MHQSRTPARVIVSCAMLTAGLILFLMAWTGMLDNAWDSLVETAKDVARFFWE